MKKTMLKILPGTALSALMLVSAMAWSGGDHRGGDFGDGRMMAHMTEKLELNDAQQQEIRTLVETSREAGKADHQRMREIRDALQAMRGNFNAGEAQKLSTELGEITARATYRMTETGSQVYALLTPEQQAEMDSFKEKRHERGKGKRRPGDAAE